MNELRLLWTSIGGVQFKGSRGIIRAWGEEMARKGWRVEDDLNRWEEVDLVFLGSDSQLYHLEHVLGKKPSILFFWGWEPARLLDRGFQKVAQEQLKRMAQCTRILVPSVVTMDQAADFGLPSQLCLPGVDSRLLDQVGPQERILQIMFLSRLVPHKHPEALIHAMSLIEASPPLELLVVGPGDNRPYVELANELGVKATFKELTDEEKVVELRRSSILVHPSSYEGLGLPPLEALYCGTSVLAFDIPQMRWLLQEDAYFFSTVEELAQMIVHVLQNPHESQAKASHGAQRVRDSLTLEHACDRLWSHVHQVIKEHLGWEIRQKPEEQARIYDNEHRRNWAYSVDRFDPTWERHWRAQSFIQMLKECGAKDILDIGCGTVYPTIFARAGFNVFAIDISEECIRQVNVVAEKWGVSDKVHAHQMDATKLIYKDSEFDAVIQAEIWEHVPDVEKVISEGLRVLKPGGYLIASTPIGTHHFDPMHIRIFDDQSIQTLVRKFEVDGGAKVKRLDKIAENEQLEASCYLIVLEKSREEKASP